MYFLYKNRYLVLKVVLFQWL